MAAAVHYPSDIALSALLAAVLGAVASGLVTRWLPVLLAAQTFRRHAVGRWLVPLLGGPTVPA